MSYDFNGDPGKGKAAPKRHTALILVLISVERLVHRVENLLGIGFGGIACICRHASIDFVPRNTSCCMLLGLERLALCPVAALEISSAVFCILKAVGGTWIRLILGI